MQSRRKKHSAHCEQIRVSNPRCNRKDTRPTCGNCRCFPTAEGVEGRSAFAKYSSTASITPHREFPRRTWLLSHRASPRLAHSTTSQNRSHKHRHRQRTNELTH
eukprot:4715899-Pleurochrysis_carterae.AAC.4